jgi:hypothetical protein
MEIWTIKEDWSTLKIHASIEEANNFVHPEAFQTLYSEGPDMPVHVFKYYK